MVRTGLRGACCTTGRNDGERVVVTSEGETRRVDAELGSAARAARATYAGAVDRRVAAASALAGSRVFQRALLRDDRSTLEGLLASHPDLALQARGTRIGPPADPGASR